MSEDDGLGRDHGRVVTLETVFQGEEPRSVSLDDPATQAVGALHPPGRGNR